MVQRARLSICTPSHADVCLFAVTLSPTRRVSMLNEHQALAVMYVSRMRSSSPPGWSPHFPYVALPSSVTSQPPSW